MTSVVDIHCHTFNADDLPVRGFIRRTQFEDRRLGDLVAGLADRLVDGAPGFTAEKGRLDLLLGADAFADAFETAVEVPAPVAEFERDVDRAMRMLDERDPGLVRQVGATMLDAESSGLEGFGDWFNAARRAVRWVSMFRAYRLDNTLLMIANFGDRIDLYTPLTVDLEFGLHDRTETTPRQQVVLQEKISRLSMLGRLPGVNRGRVHPFIGFDPRREVQDQISGEVESALDVVKLAITTYGFVGVKLYPPMGFRPIGNQATVDMSAELAARVDGVLNSLYDWCQSEDVPITAHCSSGVHAHDTFADFASPAHWARVLADYPRLRLNLGHFGGETVSPVSDSWPWQIARLATGAHPRLFADIGNHRIYDATFRDGYFAMLRSMFDGAETAGMVERLMFGSDWYMMAIHPEHDAFLDQYQAAYEDHFDATQATSFFGGAALRFLGFDDPNSGSNVRLAARYARYAPDRVPAWLAGTRPAASDPSEFALPGDAS